jgi:hypothetical protein
MSKNLLSAFLLSALTCTAWAGPQPDVHRKTLHAPAEIQGYPCAKGYAWFFADGRLNRCTVSAETAFGEARIPAGTYIALNPDGTTAFIQMSHDAPILGVTCMGGSWLGPSEGAMVGFYPSGKLKQCYLAGDQTVQGVPCAPGGLLASLRGVDPSVLFYESGKLHACKLAKDFGGKRKGERFSQAP